ncbi:MAG TPA: hypothetical protein VME18_10220 [Acidobacteriaceae bacterium]|nr:hypothetical protein [Acidobacteriaceae bacterium]
MRKLLAALLPLAFCAFAFAQQPLNNDSVVKMVKGGLDDGTIVTMIQNSPGRYDLSTDALVALRKDGISDKVIGAMAAKNAAPPPPSAADAMYANLDVGVYWHDKGVWSLMPTEIVNWKTGGVLKSFATDGIVKGDVNGHLHGAESPTKVTTPLEFLIRTPGGVEATDYQLVHLHQKKDAREFRTKTGGVFHASGGDTRDAVTFQQTRVAKGTYKVTLPDNLPPGEYAFLAPGLSNSTASGSAGRAYTFHLLE